LKNKNKHNDFDFKSKSHKVSILGYTVYRTKGTDNKDYKFKDHFLNIKTSEKSIRDSVNVQMSIKELKKDNLIGDITLSPYLVDLDNTIEPQLGHDYIVFDNKAYIKKFNEFDKDKLIMSESKGELDEKHDNNKSFKYQISTYKGQSGSPIFLRSLKVNNNINNNNSSYCYEDEYDYRLIGLHSRSDRYYYSEFSNSPQKNYCGGYSKLALSICGETINKIEHVVRALVSENTSISIINENRNDFVNMKIYLNEEVKLCGLLRKNIPLWLVFNFGSSILNINNEFILLKEMHTNAVIQNYNYDSFKLLQNIMVDNNCFYLNFELLINIKLYGEVMAKKVILKFLENYDLEEKQLKKLSTSNKLIKKLFSNVFSELSMFSSMRSLYGRLFKKIKHLILKKLEIEENIGDDENEISITHDY